MLSFQKEKLFWKKITLSTALYNSRPFITVYYFQMDKAKSYGGLGFIFSAIMTEPALRQPYNINYKTITTFS